MPDWVKISSLWSENMAVWGAQKSCEFSARFSDKLSGILFAHYKFGRLEVRSLVSQITHPQLMKHMTTADEISVDLPWCTNIAASS